MTNAPLLDGPHRALFATIALLTAVGVSSLAACASTGAATAFDAATAAPPASARPTGPAVYGPEHVGLELPGDEVCSFSPGGEAPVAAGSYRALLRNARCEQQKFATMARLALTLGVDCRHCHAPDPNDPKNESFPVDTPNKRKAVWMYQTFVQGLRLADGTPTMCASCHRDPTSGQPVAKILGDPRDPVRTMEWMHEMTARFVTRDGGRLRCKTCHRGMAPGQPAWLPTMIGEDWLRDALAAGGDDAGSGPAVADEIAAGGASAAEGTGGTGGGPDRETDASGGGDTNASAGGGGG